MWPIEPIPDEDSLFYRIHKNFYPNKELKPRVFAPRGEGMSTDWEEYSTPEESRNRAKIPEDNGIVSFITRDLRNLPLDVIHAPIGNDPIFLIIELIQMLKEHLTKK